MTSITTLQAEEVKRKTCKQNNAVIRFCNVTAIFKPAARVRIPGLLTGGHASKPVDSLSGPRRGSSLFIINKPPPSLHVQNQQLNNDVCRLKRSRGAVDLRLQAFPNTRAHERKHTDSISDGMELTTVASLLRVTSSLCRRILKARQPGAPTVSHP